MFRLLENFKTNPNVDWAVKGAPPILPNIPFTQTISHFEKDEGRSVSNDDMKTLLKSAKQDLAKDQGNSTLIVESPTQRTVNNYLALPPRLELNRTRWKKVQMKSEAQYIAERNLRNAISHVMSVAVAHY